MELSSCRAKKQTARKDRLTQLQAGALFLHKERKILAYIVARLRTFWCTFTGLNNGVVSQDGKILGMMMCNS